MERTEKKNSMQQTKNDIPIGAQPSTTFNDDDDDNRIDSK